MHHNTPQPSTSWRDTCVAAFGISALVLLLAVYGGFKLPIITDMHNAIILVAFLGIGMCLVGGIGPTIRRFGWKSFEVLTGAVLGILSSLILAYALFGLPLPFIGSDETALTILAILLMAKVVIAQFETD